MLYLARLVKRRRPADVGVYLLLVIGLAYTHYFGLVLLIAELAVLVLAPERPDCDRAGGVRYSLNRWGEAGGIGVLGIAPGGGSAGRD